MSVRDRLDDMMVLLEAGRYNGAVLSFVIAIAGTAKKRYPHGTPSIANSARRNVDKEAFEAMLVDLIPGGLADLGVEFADRVMPLKEVLYVYLRCFLVHEAITGPRVEVRPSALTSTTMSREYLGRIVIDAGFFAQLALAVAACPENASEFQSIPWWLTPSDAAQ